MTTTTASTPLVRLGNLFPEREVYAKCEFLSPSGSFKDRGAAHLLTKLSCASGNRLLVVPSMGNTAHCHATAPCLENQRLCKRIRRGYYRQSVQRLNPSQTQLLRPHRVPCAVLSRPGIREDRDRASARAAAAG